MPDYLTYSHLGKMGGFGHQLWQIGSTVGIARKNNIDNNTKWHVRFPKWQYSKYFSFPEHFFVGAQGRNSWIEADWLAKDNHKTLQDLTSLEYAKNDMKKWLRPSDLAMAKLSVLFKRYSPHDATAVHIRRGEYEHLWGGRNLIDKNWYMKNWPKGPVLVFSDDIGWCQNHIHKDNAIFVQHMPWLDFMLMSHCRALIISNSTFAWWAAFNSNSTEITYPTPWLVDKDLDIFDPSWGWKASHRK